MGLCCCKICDDDYDLPIDERNVGARGSRHVQPSSLSRPVRQPSISRQNHPRVVPSSQNIHRVVPRPRPTQQPPITRQPSSGGVTNKYFIKEIRSPREPTVVPSPRKLPINQNNSTTLRVVPAEPRHIRPPITPTETIQPPNVLDERPKQTTITITKDENLVLPLLKALPVCHHTMYIPPIGTQALETLDAKSDRFLRVKLFSHPKFNANYRIYQAFRVWNPFLMAQYGLNKKKYESECKECHLFHGTGLDAVAGIVTHNFDWRKTTESWYGHGVYFAKNPFYAALYSLKRQNRIAKSPIYVMFVAKVLIDIDERNIDKSHPNTAVPDQGHTTISQHDHEVIKYDDGCFYPEFIVYFQQIISKL